MSAKRRAYTCGTCACAPQLRRQVVLDDDQKLRECSGMRRKFSSFYDGSRLLTWECCLHRTRCGLAREICRGFSSPGRGGQARRCSSRAHEKAGVEELKHWFPSSREPTPIDYSGKRRVLSKEACLSISRVERWEGLTDSREFCSGRIEQLMDGWVLPSMHRNLVLLSASPQTWRVWTVDQQANPHHITCLFSCDVMCIACVVVTDRKMQFP